MKPHEILFVLPYGTCGPERVKDFFLIADVAFSFYSYISSKKKTFFLAHPT